MKYLHSAHVTRTPATEHVTDHFNDLCIGVMHILDMYASELISIIIAIRGEPLTRYEEITKIDPAQRNSDPPRVYIAVLNKLS
jgi:hypothetical protein